MITIINNIIPVKGFVAMCLWPFLFIRKSAQGINERTINHEKIHGRQQLEMLLVLFFVWYGIEWLVRLILYLDTKEAYRNISFEQEAYTNESNMKYLESRKWYAWITYLGKKTYKKT